MSDNAPNHKRIPVAAPSIDERDVSAVADVVRSGRLALGERTHAFENLMAKASDRRHAIAVSSGTAALHLAVRGLGWGEGDEVITTSFSFIASANCLLFERARPVFVDVSPDDLNIDPDAIAEAITPRTRGILAVDVFGQPARWDEILEIARDHDLKVIEDSCEALGSTYKGRPAGAFGDAAAFAFYPNKQISTGEGGVLLTNDDGLADGARAERNQGRAPGDAWLTHSRLGFNYRLDEMSAALGTSQFERFESLRAGRARAAAAYGNGLSKLDWVETPTPRRGTTVDWFVYVVRLAPGTDRDAMVRELDKLGVETRPYFPPIHKQAFYMDLLRGTEVTLPVTEAASRRTLALPFHAGLDATDVGRVVAALETARSRVQEGRA